LLVAVAAVMAEVLAEPLALLTSPHARFLAVAFPSPGTVPMATFILAPASTALELPGITVTGALVIAERRKSAVPESLRSVPTAAVARRAVVVHSVVSSAVESILT
jgi:hypothetical protein